MATATRRKSTKSTSATPRVDAYQVITDQVIELLEKGVAPWRKPWDANHGIPRSMSSGKAYRGINPFLLEISALANGYASPFWGTYKQITERGGNLKGQKGTQITLWKTFTVKDETTGKPKTIPMLRIFTVFNADQNQNDVDLKLPGVKTVPAHDRIEDCETAIEGYLSGPTGPRYQEGGDAAYYSPVQDLVAMPALNAFDSAEEYYGAKFHELVHSTGAKKRLDREGITEGHRFGDELYSKEELIAELGSAFLSGTTGIAVATLGNSASYLQSWITVLRGDKKLLVSAAGKAQKAADMVLGVTVAASTDDTAPAADGDAKVLVAA